MLAIFLQVLPFFAVVGVGWLGARLGAFPPEATAWLTKFVFIFPLSAMLFRLTMNLSLADIWDPVFAAAYMAGTGSLFVIMFALSRLRGVSLSEAAIEAQTGVIGNTGFMGVPMLGLILGAQAAGPILLVLSLDTVLFGALISLLLTAGQRGGVHLRDGLALGLGIVKNPMVISMVGGFIWSGLQLPVPQAMDASLALLGAAATPCALFAIGASLAARSAERLVVAGWLALVKLIAHPALIALMALVIFPVDPAAAAVMIATAALPVAGNIYILASTYGVAPQRVSTAILLSTIGSIVTVPMVIHWVQSLH